MQASVVGHIENVLSGIVPEELRERWIDARSLKCAFEIGSPEGIESLGETIVLNGIAYTQSTQSRTLIYGEKLLTTGLFILPKGAKPSEMVRGEGPISAGELYELLHQRVNAPFAYVGLISFDQLEATAITKPPIYGERIFDHKKAYYADPPVHQKGAHAAIMGIAAPSPLNEKLSMVLYKNPFETPGEINAHSHILLLKNKVTNLSEVSPGVAQSVLHLFPQSIVSSYALELYPIEDLADL